jgi:glycerophosphoryl diester phosphodiesterase
LLTLMSMQIVGHRGAAGVAPENTLPSFEAAWAAGVAWVETDVRLTRDGVPVLLHDATLDRTTTGHGAVSALIWPEVQAVDAGLRFSPAFEGTRVPRLEELLTAAAGRSGVLIELKAETERPDLLVERVLAAIAAAGADQWVRLISFEADLLERVATTGRGAVPDIPTGFIASEAAGILETALRLSCAAIHPRLSALSPSLLEAAHSAGLRVNTWTANTPEQVRFAAEVGVDEITTDFPVLAMQTQGRAG